MKTIDCRGQACPAPVIATKKALEESVSGVCVIVDDGAPLENVTRFASNRGYSVHAAANGDSWKLELGLAKTDNIPAAPADRPDTSGDTVLLICSDKLGEGADELGRLLMKNFIFTLLETAQRPDKILLLNTGVLLAVHGADTAEALANLEQRGTEVFACGICLDYLNKKEQLAAGKVTNMFSTAENLLMASSVIKL